jgi:hypothetical protein
MKRSRPKRNLRNRHDGNLRVTTVTSAQIHYGKLCRCEEGPLQLLLHHGKEESPIRQLRVDKPTGEGTTPHGSRNASHSRNHA